VEQYLEYSVIREVMSDHLTERCEASYVEQLVRSKCLASTKRHRAARVETTECKINASGSKQGQEMILIGRGRLTQIVLRWSSERGRCKTATVFL
jgi:hypothetical protein